MAPPQEGFAPKYHDIYDYINPSNFVGHNTGKVAFSKTAILLKYLFGI